MKKSKYITITIVLLLLGGITLMYNCCSSKDEKKQADSVLWLPEKAKNITHYREGGFSHVEFIECTLPEKEFKQLAEQQKWDIIPRRSVYISFYELLDKIPLRTAPQTEKGFIPEAYFYENDNITVIYDRNHNRLFYYSDD